MISIMASTKTSFRPDRRHLLPLVLLLFALYVVVPQLGSFHDSLKLVRHPVLQPLVTALAATGLTYLLATGTYCLLAFKPLAYRRTLLVQLSSLFVNRVLPAGVGALGVNYLYLRRSQHTTAQAAAVVAANNLLGIVGHGLLLGLVVSLAGGRWPALQIDASHASLFRVLVAAGALLALSLLLFGRKKRAGRAAGAALRQLTAYRHRPAHVGLALMTSMSLTLCTVGSLWLSLSAVHVHLAFITVLVVFTFGLGVGTATPTPGGLGGLEAGLVAGLVAYHVPSSAAVAGVFLYRLLNYWLGLAIGAVAFIFAQRHSLFKL